MVIKVQYCVILNKIRNERGLTQEEVASILGIDRKTYNHYEVQENIIPIKHLIPLVNYLNISIDYLFGLTNNEQYKNISFNIDNIKAGLRLKEFRKENNLTLKDLAAFLNTTFSNISWYEKGRNLIATSFLYMICLKYKISADYLLGRIDKPKYLK